MSEIREKARSFLNHGAEINRHKLIHDLLTELERVENDTAKVKLAYAEGKITGRQQAARECIEKARSFLNHGAEINRHKLIHDLLAELERVEQWKEAVIDACVVSWVLKKEHENNPHMAVADLCSWCHSIALDPKVSSEAKALHGRIAELECQKNACQQVISERDQRIDELEAENARLKADLSGSFFVDQIKEKARQQAAREAAEIIDKYPASLFGTNAIGVKLNLSQSIKARFGLDG